MDDPSRDYEAEITRLRAERDAAERELADRKADYAAAYRAIADAVRVAEGQVAAERAEKERTREVATELLATLKALLHPDVESLVYFVASDAWAMQLHDEAVAAVAKAEAALASSRAAGRMRAERDKLYGYVNGLIGLTQLIRGRDDVSAEAKEALRTNHRATDPAAYLTRIVPPETLSTQAKGEHDGER